MKTNLLDYYKLILSKVSFDGHLLKKEYLKAVRVLKGEEISELLDWMEQNELPIKIR